MNAFRNDDGADQVDTDHSVSRKHKAHNYDGSKRAKAWIEGRRSGLRIDLRKAADKFNVHVTTIGRLCREAEAAGLLTREGRSLYRRTDKLLASQLGGDSNALVALIDRWIEDLPLLRKLASETAVDLASVSNEDLQAEIVRRMKS